MDVVRRGIEIINYCIFSAVVIFGILVIIVVNGHLGVLERYNPPKLKPRTVATAKVMSCSDERRFTDVEMIKLLGSPAGRNTRLASGCPRP